MPITLTPEPRGRRAWACGPTTNAACPERPRFRDSGRRRAGERSRSPPSSAGVWADNDAACLERPHLGDCGRRRAGERSRSLPSSMGVWADEALTARTARTARTASEDYSRESGACRDDGNAASKAARQLRGRSSPAGRRPGAGSRQAQELQAGPGGSPARSRAWARWALTVPGWIPSRWATAFVDSVRAYSRTVSSSRAARSGGASVTPRLVRDQGPGRYASPRAPGQDRMRGQFFAGVFGAATNGRSTSSGAFPILEGQGAMR